MKKILNLELILQISIILACLTIILLRFSDSSAKAQTDCEGIPKFKDNTSPKREAWLPNKPVKVVIFDTPNATDFGLLNQGIQYWNEKSSENCSFVNFQEAIPGTNQDQSQEPDTGEMWVLRPPSPNGQLIAFYRNTGQPTQSVRSARMLIRNTYTFRATIPHEIDSLAAHETGHSFGFINTDNAEYNQTIMGPTQVWVNWKPTNCDWNAIRKIYCPTTATPTPRPQPTYYPAPEWCNNPIGNFSGDACPMGFSADPNGGYCCQDQPSTPEPTPEVCESDMLDEGPYSIGGGDYECYPCFDGVDNDCDRLWDISEPNCYTCWHSPVLIDILGNGFNLTNAANGVDFDFNGDGIHSRISWTSADSDDAWLVLDRDGNNTIDSGMELFGNLTAQPSWIPKQDRNGFLALAEFDKSENGGDDDGRITDQDAVFSGLRLWQDSNHNGISEVTELKTLNELSLTIIELDYKESKHIDEHGNRFKYRAKVRDRRGAQVGRWAWDVFLAVQQR